jgi:ATP-binding protein involved in chromosome partitioning
MKNSLNVELKIAFPTNDGQTVEEHFGHCKKFAIYTVRENKIMSKEYVDAPKHEPGVLPRFLGEQGATTIITGGMGQMAIKLFKDQGVDVILGATGSIEDNLKEYLGGELHSTGAACTHHHDENCSH